MNDSDDAMAALFADMLALIETRKLGLSASELAQCRGFVVSTAALCDEARRYCDRQNFTDAQAREYLRGVLAGIIERTQQIPMTISMGGALH
jgi:hypothetical protein